MVRRSVGAGTLVLAAIGGARAQTAEPLLDGGRQDLRTLIEWVNAEASFTDAGRRRALTLIDEYLAAKPAADLPALYLQIASVVGLADNGHSNLGSAPVYSFGLLPIRTHWFSDGLFVVRARSDVTELLGARVDSIAGIGVDELVTRLGALHGGTDALFRQYYSTPLMLSPAILHAAGLSANPDRMSVSVTTTGGGHTRVELTADESPAPPRRVPPWRRLLPGSMPDESGSWSTVVRDADLPLALQDANEPFRYIEMPQEGVVYIQLRANHDQGSVSLHDFVRDTRTRLVRDPPRLIILDNRFNGGGDLTVTADLALDLPELVRPGGRVFVLTSNATYSAGIYTSFFPKATDPDRTLILGEHVGDRGRFWAEARGPFVLPGTGWRISRSRQLHDLEHGCSVPDVCFAAGRGRLNIAVGTLNPDVVIRWTFGDYLAGRDPVLDYALAHRPTSLEKDLRQ